MAIQDWEDRVHFTSLAALINSGVFGAMEQGKAAEAAKNIISHLGKMFFGEDEVHKVSPEEQQMMDTLAQYGVRLSPEFIRGSMKPQQQPVPQGKISFATPTGKMLK